MVGTVRAGLLLLCLSQALGARFVLWNDFWLQECNATATDLLGKWGIDANAGNAQNGRVVTILGGGSVAGQHKHGPFMDWPTIDGKTGAGRGGSLPQRANRSAAMASIRQAFDELPPDFSGALQFDWEKWDPLWEYTPAQYRNASIRWVNERKPGLGPDAVLALARTEWESAAKEWLLGPLLEARRRFPKAKVGYYNYPKCANGMKCEQYPEGTNATAANDRLAWLWEASTALFPTVYYDFVWHSGPHPIVAEAVRVGQTADHPVAVVPVWWYYGCGSYSRFCPKENVDSQLSAVAAAGADGLAIWGGSWNVTKAGCASIESYIATVLGPAARQFIGRGSHRVKSDVRGGPDCAAATACWQCERMSGCSWCNDTGRGPSPKPAGFCKQAARPADCIRTIPSSCVEPPPPPGGPPNALALALKRQLTSARDGETVLVKPGDYRFGSETLLLQHVVGVKVVEETLAAPRRGAAGEKHPVATLWFSCGAGLKLLNCTDVELTGLRIDYSEPCLAQGKVVPRESVANLSDDSVSVVVADFDSRFLLPDAKEFSVGPLGIVEVKTKTALFSGQGAWLSHDMGPDCWLRNATRLEGGPAGHVRYAARLAKPMVPVPQAGMVLAMWPRLGQSSGLWKEPLTLMLVNCTRVTVSGLVIRGAAQEAIVEAGGAGGHVYRGVRVIRRQDDTEDEQAAELPRPLLASNADGFHSTAVARGSLLENCEISWTGDDFYNSHSRMQILLQPSVAGDPRAVYAIDTLGWSSPAGADPNTLSFGRLPPDALIKAFDLHSQRLLGSARVARATPLPAAEAAALADRAALEVNRPPYSAGIALPGFPLPQNAAPIGRSVWLLNLTAELAAPRFSLLNVDALSASGAVVRNCHFHDSNGGVCFRSIAGTIDGLRTERAGAKFSIGCSPTWLEGSLGLTNVSVRNSVLVHNVSIGQCVRAVGGSVRLDNVTVHAGPDATAS